MNINSMLSLFEVWVKDCTTSVHCSLTLMSLSTSLVWSTATYLKLEIRLDARFKLLTSNVVVCSASVKNTVMVLPVSFLSLWAALIFLTPSCKKLAAVTPYPKAY
jgi:hypothetical protein